MFRSHLSSITLCAAILPLVSFGCGIFGSSDYPPLETVASVDVDRYCGLWYEIASLPVSQQKGCRCTTAEYSKIDATTIRVVNRCIKDDGEDSATAKAFVVDGSGNAKLRVQFFWPFRGDYWIVELAPDYSYAVVGVPNRKYFWILSRTKTMDGTLLDQILGRLKANGFDVSRAQRTVHDCGGAGA
jgi:apolipoprotein D and lipocalin family protein